MAEGKKSIVVYADWIKKFEKLSDDEAGRLIKHFFRYVNDENPIAPDRITELSFIDIEQSLKRDLIKWEKRAERSRENGKSGGRPPSINPEKPKETQQVILKPRKPDSVNDSVNDIIIKEQFDFFWKKYPKKVAKDNCFAKFKKLPESDRIKILSTIDSFISYKPFDTYNHPNPETYFNQKRFNDDIPKQQATVGYSPQSTN